MNIGFIESGKKEKLEVILDGENIGYMYTSFRNYKDDYSIYIYEGMEEKLFNYKIKNISKKIDLLYFKLDKTKFDCLDWITYSCDLQLHLKPFWRETVPYFSIEVQPDSDNWKKTYSFIELVQMFKEKCNNEDEILYYQPDEIEANGIGIKLEINKEDVSIKNLYNSILQIFINLMSDTTNTLSLNNNSSENNSFLVNIKIKEEFKIILKQYLAYFNSYVKNTIQQNIEFYVDENDYGLVLNFKANNYNELENIKNSLSEFVSFTEKSFNEIVPKISEKTTEYEKQVLMLDLRAQLRHYHAMIESVKDKIKILDGKNFNELDYLSATTLIDGFNRISQTLPQSNIYLEQNQNQSQNQNQNQILQTELLNLTKELDNLINHINSDSKVKFNRLLEEIYSIGTNPTKEKIEKVGVLPKLNSFMTMAKESLDLVDEGKEIYNRVANNYNTLAKIMNYSFLTLL